ncbi:MAG: hypothetical protein FGF52_06635 [Candidatus Brockarchaeota archaeon]|nr:hypothetical protein [Candidatus Brockarchaeota archaeon]
MKDLEKRRGGGFREKIRAVGKEVDKRGMEVLVEYHIYRYLDHGAHLFTFDGYAITGYRIGHEYKFRFWVDRKQKKFKRLEPVPLEKIEFLKEDFPEMFK